MHQYPIHDQYPGVSGLQVAQSVPKLSTHDAWAGQSGAMRAKANLQVEDLFSPHIVLDSLCILRSRFIIIIISFSLRWHRPVLDHSPATLSVHRYAS